MFPKKFAHFFQSHKVFFFIVVFVFVFSCFLSGSLSISTVGAPAWFGVLRQRDARKSQLA